NGYSDNILVKLFISEIVHTKVSFLLKLYYKFNFATEPYFPYALTKHFVQNQDFGIFYRNLPLQELKTGFTF
ncbi:hypothetical protein, partial [Staphylococcus simulans]|uniref:hypothetical protein n=1 Tax=Staphylococcus simulans TaxID=1286 RepID=UPI003CF67B76